MAIVDDVLDDLARKVKRDVVSTCAKVALIHANPKNSDDYNRACRDIAAKLSELGGRPIKSTEAA
jgi:hypothetical protein